jgi:hypothetical protein
MPCSSTARRRDASAGTYPVPMTSDQQQRRTSGWPPTKREWVGFAVALVVATSLFVLLGWFQVLR